MRVYVVLVHSFLIMQSAVSMILLVTQGAGPVGLLVEAEIPENFIPATYKSFNRLTSPAEPYYILLANHDFVIFYITSYNHQ